jgi:DNA-binding NtrC family response regulator
MAESIAVLLVDDEERFRTTLAKLLSRHGFSVRDAGGCEAAVTLLQEAPAMSSCSTSKCPGYPVPTPCPCFSGVPEAEVLVLTGHASVDIAAAMIAGGAADYLLKPCPTDELEGAIRAVYDRRQATRPR